MALPEDVNNEEEENDFFDIAGDVLAAPFRGIEGAFQGAYNLADYLAFDVLPDYDTRFLGTSKTMALPEDVNNEEEENDFFDIAGDVLAAPFRGIEGAFQGAYNLADYLAFDVLPDYDTRFLGTSKTMAGGAVEGISQFATGFIPLFGLAGRAGALAKAGTATKAVVAGAATGS